MQSRNPETKLRESSRLFSSDDLRRFASGGHDSLYERLGAHVVRNDKETSWHFSVWAPNATGVSVIGDYNGWGRGQALTRVEETGIWEGSVAEVRGGTLYKYQIETANGRMLYKADPFAFCAEAPPGTASVCWELQYRWNDAGWVKRRKERTAPDRAMSIYEVHLGSWRRDPRRPDRFLTYRELAPSLADYLTRMNFSHVEFLPVMEHPYYGSWGYQTTGYFAPTRRYGDPEDLMFMIDYLHQAGIGVILDWVPSHFASDEHGLGVFDGTHLFEHEDPRRGYHPEWGSYIFDYERGEVRSFLLSSAMFWLDVYHADALRVDGVASMLYLDYSRRPGEWLPNERGGRENIEAIEFFRQLNTRVYSAGTGVQTIAEESTAWPMVSRPASEGGLGFGMKWDMGWMHDTLQYMKVDPLFRSAEHRKLTFRGLYAFSEKHVLPLSHDEVVHGKKSLLDKMPGDYWQKFANLRAFYCYFMAHPGKKLLFMGGEFGQFIEWQEWKGLDWNLLQYEMHAKLQAFSSYLLHTYRREAALWEQDCGWNGFRWIDCQDADNSVIAFLRLTKKGKVLLVVVNFTPVIHYNYRVGVPQPGRWREVLNSDEEAFGGSGQKNTVLEAEPVSWHGYSSSLTLLLPPLATIYLKPEEQIE